MFTIHKNNSGFTLLELMIIIAILGVLASMAIQSMIATRAKAMDAAALSETLILGKVILNTFLDGIDVDLTHAEGGGSAIGTKDTNGGERTPIFTFSSGIEAHIEGDSDVKWCTATVWHPNGTKSYTLIIDEDANQFSLPTS